MAEVRTEFGSIFKAISTRANKAKFGNVFFATQITLIGDLDYLPLYVKVEDKVPEVAPYEYIGANFYIDADAATLAQVLNGKLSIYDAIDSRMVKVNGEAGPAAIFISKVLD